MSYILPLVEINFNKYGLICNSQACIGRVCLAINVSYLGIDQIFNHFIFLDSFTRLNINGKLSVGICLCFSAHYYLFIRLNPPLPETNSHLFYQIFYLGIGHGRVVIIESMTGYCYSLARYYSIFDSVKFDVKLRPFVLFYIESF